MRKQQKPISKILFSGRRYILCLLLACLLSGCGLIEKAGGVIDHLISGSDEQTQAARPEEPAQYGPQISTDEDRPEGLQVRIVDSYYQKVEGYTWQDLFSIMASIPQTTPNRGERKPVIALLEYPDIGYPLYFLGLSDEALETASLDLFVLDDGYIYELLSFEDEVFYSAEKNCFFLKNAGKQYTYAPHVLLEQDLPQSEWPEDTVRLPLSDISRDKVTTEGIGAYVIDLSEGGEADE